MRRLKHSAILTLLATLSLLFVQPAGCAGQKVRESVGVPTLVQFDDQIIEEAYVGVDTLPEAERPNAAGKVTAFSTAMQAGDLLSLTTDAWPRWPDVKTLATAGIEHRRDSGQIGVGVAASKLERLEKFGKLLAKTVGAPP